MGSSPAHLVRSYLAWETRPLGECELREERIWRDGGHGQVVAAVVILSRVTVAQGTNGHK